MLSLRKGWRALGEGRVEFLTPQNRKILAYVLRHEQETLLVVANLSRFPQPVELDLSAFKGRTPVELFGRTRFPDIGALPFLLTLGPHGFYWFSLEPPLPAPQSGAGSAEPRAVLNVEQAWEEVLSERLTPALERAFVPYLRTARWFLPPAKAIKSATLQEAGAVPLESAKGRKVELTVREPAPTEASTCEVRSRISPRKTLFWTLWRPKSRQRSAILVRVRSFEMS